MSAPARVKWFGKAAAVVVAGPYLYIYGSQIVCYGFCYSDIRRQWTSSCREM